MIAHHIHDALAQVRQLREVVLEKRGFHGYSGLARVVAGVMALVGTAVLALPAYPATNLAHLVGWGGVLALALGLNYGALARWFLCEPEARRELLRVLPAIDAVPPLAVGALFSVLFVKLQLYPYLPGMWMCLYGLAHFPYRLALPKANYAVGVGYLLCGAATFLFADADSFMNPWPMGLVFCAGELAGGIVLYRNHGGRNGKHA